MAGVEVTVEGLSKSFGRANIWSDVTLTLPPGEVAVLLGPSGYADDPLPASPRQEDPDSETNSIEVQPPLPAPGYGPAADTFDSYAPGYGDENPGRRRPRP